MTPEDLQDMSRRYHQEQLLFVSGFEPVQPGGRKLWVRDYELFTRGRALVTALRELAAGEVVERALEALDIETGAA